MPDQPPVADESGFKRSHDREFERNWHMVALQRDMTEEDAQTILEARQKVSVMYIIEMRINVVPQYSVGFKIVCYGGTFSTI